MLLTKVVMEININEAFVGKDIGVDEKVSVRQGFDTFLCIRMMLGSKHANLMYECITYYIYAYQLRCTKQDVPLCCPQPHSVSRILRKLFLHRGEIRTVAF